MKLSRRRNNNNVLVAVTTCWWLILLATTTTTTTRCGGCVSAFSIEKKRSSPMLTASSQEKNGAICFDTNCIANPVVLPPPVNNDDNNGGGEWQCYYYGNNGSWSGGRPTWLPTGSTGLAISSNGYSDWKKIQGSEQDGAILTPSFDDDSAWDAVHTGVGDVIRINSNELHMYYFGADTEEISVPSVPGNNAFVGLRMRIGRAKSNDNGRTWTKDDKNFLLDFDKSEGFFASWPRIVTYENDEPWKMFYHAFDGVKWRVFGAESKDMGDTWTRTGLVLEGGTDEEHDFDFSGIGTRSVIKWRDGLLMIYEGVDKKSIHRFGAAYCKPGGGGKFQKLNDGKPILEPGKGVLGDWTNLVIGCPFVVPMPDGSLRLYHCGRESTASKMAIGVLVSPSGDVSPDSWEVLA